MDGWELLNQFVELAFLGGDEGDEGEGDELLEHLFCEIINLIIKIRAGSS